MRYLHTMVRVSNLEDSLTFYCDGLGLKEVDRHESEQGKFTNVFLASPDDIAACETPPKEGLTVGLPVIELTYNWTPEDYKGGRNFGHLAYEVDDIYAMCAKLEKMGITINRPPRDGRMAFMRSPDQISIELLQKGEPLPPAEPWVSAPNIGEW
ncbi:VOC family protein [Hirschia litorea]|uniref:VOC family protein n=1 Tax=Hirschia litorea TaxID=1199156 RepID=A0ABW2IN14_9PROT